MEEYSDKEDLIIFIIWIVSKIILVGGVIYSTYSINHSLDELQNAILLYSSR